MNNLADTSLALQTLSALTYPNYEIILVDNGSTDSSLATLRARFPYVTVIENGANLGFAAGNNVGLKYAAAHDAQYMMLLNNDIKVAPDFLDALVAAAQSDPTIGVIGPAIYDFDGQPNNLGWRFNPRWGYSVRIRAASSPSVPHHLTSSPPHLLVDAHTISGCALMLTRDAYKKIGGLDESFHYLVEDVEYCLRCRKAGYRIATATRSKLWHQNCSTLARRSSMRLYYEYRNTLLLMRRHARPWHWLTFLPHFILKYLRDRRSIKRDTTLTPDSRSLKLRALTRGITDFLTGHSGPGPAWLSNSV
jgi:hypothetical protein